MPLFFKKSLIKLSTLAILGVSAYFLGYFWGMKNLGSEANSRSVASVPEKQSAPVDTKSDQATDLRQLK
jgi:hypothetical protein